MIEIQNGLFVGADRDCRKAAEGWAIVHACKSPCHQRAVGYRGSLPPSHDHYLVFREGGDLYLNMIDPPRPLFMPPLFLSFLAFAQEYSDSGVKILIHCNQGESRAPSLALLFLAKVAGTISNDSYEAAESDFGAIFNRFNPGAGIRIYLSSHWREFDDFQ